MILLRIIKSISHKASVENLSAQSAIFLKQLWWENTITRSLHVYKDKEMLQHQQMFFFLGGAMVADPTGTPHEIHVFARDLYVMSHNMSCTLWNCHNIHLHLQKWSKWSILHTKMNNVKNIYIISQLQVEILPVVDHILKYSLTIIVTNPE